MNVIRPEVKEFAWRWREVLVAFGLAALGLWWALTGFGLIVWIGWALVALALVIAGAGLQRARFRVGADGPGVVTVDEGQVTYFGPFGGGAVALTEITRLSLDPRGKPAVWLITQPGQPDLAVPLDAAGSEHLFDVFAALPGIQTEQMLTEMRQIHTAVPVHPVVIWEKVRPRLH